jgi:hypothetical protein
MMRPLFLALLLAGTPLRAQFLAPTARPLERDEVAIEQTAGFSWFSPGGSWGDVTNRRLYVTGIRATWLQVTSGRFGLAYTMELVPLAVVERTRPNSQRCWFTDTGLYVCRRDRSERVAYGAGGSPIGAKMYFNRTGRWRMHSSASLGAMLFSSPVPIYDSHMLNFSIDYGGGMEVTTRSGREIALGFRFQHLSNAGSGRFNPGLDANVIYLGLMRRHPR